MVDRNPPPGASLRSVARSAIEVHGVTFRHRTSATLKPALDNLTLSVREGSITGLLGPNGAGKTTFVNLLCGLLRTQTGRIAIFGEAHSSVYARRSIGFCPQELAIYTSLTATENLMLFGRLAGLGGAQLRSRVAACLETSRLQDAGGKRAELFSGGMKRRLNLAVAMIHEPRLLVLDEPTVGVDMQSRRAIFDSLVGLAKGGTTVLYTTHYMEEVERICDDVIVIDQGRALASGATRAIIDSGLRYHAFQLTLGEASHAEELISDLKWNGFQAQSISEDKLELASDDLPKLLKEIARLSALGTIAGCESVRPSLEQRFLELTENVKPEADQS